MAVTSHPSANTATTGFNGSATNPTDAYSSNDQYATFVADANPRNDEYAHLWSGFDFSSIPDGSTINSVHVHVEHKLSTNWSQGEIRMSVWADATATNSAALAPGVTGAIGPDLQYSHSTASGYTSDTDWDVTLTGTLPTLAQLKDTKFGVRVQHAQGNNGTVGLTTSIDDINIVVDYTAGATTVPGDFTADAVLHETQSGSFTANAIKFESSGELTFTADASKTLHTEDSFSADALLFESIEGSLTADAIKFQSSGEITFTADATLTLHTEDSFTADALRKETTEDSFSADAILYKEGSGSLTADATIFASSGERTFTADAWKYDPAAIGTATWVSPADTVPMSYLPTLVFTMPTFTGNAHFHLQLDTAATFDTGNLRELYTYLDQTGWEYWDGGDWVAIPATGVPDTYQGNNARYTVSTPLSGGTWYRRVRAGV